MRYNEDDRAQRYCDCFPEIGKGDINISIVYPGTIAAWHRHSKQVDYQLVIKGSLKVGVCNLPNNDYSGCKNFYEEEIVKSSFYRYFQEWKNKYYKIIDESCRKIAITAVHEKVNYDILGTMSDSHSLSDTVSKTKETPKCKFYYLSDRNTNEGPLVIPAGLWHGSYNFTNEPAILIYHITEKWDGTDEDRADVREFRWNWKREVK